MPQALVPSSPDTLGPASPQGEAQPGHPPSLRGLRWPRRGGNSPDRGWEGVRPAGQRLGKDLRAGACRPRRGVCNRLTLQRPLSAVSLKYAGSQKGNAKKTFLTVRKI